MIDYESLPGKLIHQPNRCRQLPRVNENVITEIEFPQAGDSKYEGFSQHELIIGFGLDNMPQSAQLLKSREKVQSFGKFFSRDVEPAYYAHDSVVLLRQFQEKQGLSFGVVSLYRDRCVNVIRAQLQVQFFWQEIAF